MGGQFSAAILGKVMAGSIRGAHYLSQTYVRFGLPCGCPFLRPDFFFGALRSVLDFLRGRF
jgi:hypothetical protein